MDSRILAALEDLGLLLEQDKTLPNVVSLVTGESLKTTWWSHPQAHLIFHTLTELADHPDVLTTKLMAGKVTFVHRDLWSALLAVALSREPWQLRSLSPAARRLLAETENLGSVDASGPAAKELATRLLVHSQEVHGDTGAHRLVLEPWSVWATRTHCTPLSSVDTARQLLTEAAQRLGAPARGLPWHRLVTH
ncbi:MAG TPA: hypothetical protein VHR45_06080 [Thermoanaerobaculia bacterium]|nr:hypothetical protein [Thermoanaerobaculia bacterium]